MRFEAFIGSDVWNLRCRCGLVPVPGIPRPLCHDILCNRTWWLDAFHDHGIMYGNGVDQQDRDHHRHEQRRS